MATIDFPSTPKPASTQWRLIMPAQANISEWTGARQVMASGRGWWECDLSLPTIDGGSKANPWRAFIAKMRGGANEAKIPVDGKPQEPDTDAPDGVSLSLDFVNREYFSTGGTAAGSAYVNGASQTGRSLNTDGWPENDTVLHAGEFVTINDQLLQLTADVVTGATGAATIEFEPPIRVSPADDDAIEYRNPYALMHLAEPTGYTYETGVFYGFSFKFREAF